MQYTYTDLQIEKRITQIITTDKTTNTVKKHDIYQKANNIAKLDLPSKNIENTKLDIIYEIKVTNIGDYNANYPSKQRIFGRVPKILDKDGKSTYNI